MLGDKKKSIINASKYKSKPINNIRRWERWGSKWFKQIIVAATLTTNFLRILMLKPNYCPDMCPLVFNVSSIK